MTRGSRERILRIRILAYILFLLPLPGEQWSFQDFSFWPKQDLQEPSDRSNLGTLRVLNFFPVPVEEECLAQDKRRLGICMNPYECRIQKGKSQGPCALGFGVCCVFTASCEEEVENNSTYVLSPGFPDLIDRPLNCTVLVKKIDSQVSQLRIDFVHFNIGQPNTRTGVCDEDSMEIANGRTTLTLCGWNSGQHVYVDIMEDPVNITFRLPGSLQSRMWEMRVLQLGFEQRAPTGCLQYFQAPNGTLRTLNYLPNGRYLAGQDYLFCIRQERGMCGISYAPCTRDSFRIGAGAQNPGPQDTELQNSTLIEPNLSNSTDSVNGTEIEGSGMEQEVVPGVQGSQGSFERSCRDRVLIPCDFEEFITPGNDGAGICNLEHCGNSLCNSNELDQSGNCRIETWATPFRIRVAFGPGIDTGMSLEDNTGMCLMYEQLPCVP